MVDVAKTADLVVTIEVFNKILKDLNTRVKNLEEEVRILKGLDIKKEI